MSTSSTPISTLLILGASGDLAGRLLLPAVGQVLAAGEGPDCLTLIGAGTEDLSDEEWRTRVRTSFGDASGDRVDRVVSETRYIRSDVTVAQDLQTLLDACHGAPAIYFALPPAITAKACQALAQHSLPDGTSLVLEKPFGIDEDSAAALNVSLTRLVPEERIHRVDHFLGKSAVVNILGLRFANRIFEPLWNAENIQSVDIVFDEVLALENRAGYYDGAGALVDMIQSHLLQVLSLIAMDPPPSVGARDLRQRKADALRATRIWGGDPLTASRRARYTAGSIGDRSVPAYVDENGVDPSRETETLAELTLEVDNWRWAGVPFRLRSGKAIGAKRQDLVITFKPVPRVIGGLYGEVQPNRLTIQLNPDRLLLGLNINGPGDPWDINQVDLAADFQPGRLSAYGEVLTAVFDGDGALSVRGDTAVECWRIVDPVLAAWRAGSVPLEEYPAGSSGPSGWPV